MLLNLVECIDFYDVGNVLGEIGILEHKENEIDAICETDVQVFLIERMKLELLMQRYPVLRDRMWKILGIHIASTLLIKLVEYQVRLPYHSEYIVTSTELPSQLRVIWLTISPDCGP
jgi:CRP-like cAMP-binding protein